MSLAYFSTALIVSLRGATGAPSNNEAEIPTRASSSTITLETASETLRLLNLPAFPDGELIDGRNSSYTFDGGCTSSSCFNYCRQRKHAGARCDKETCVCRNLKDLKRCLSLGYGCGISCGTLVYPGSFNGCTVYPGPGPGYLQINNGTV